MCLFSIYSDFLIRDIQKHFYVFREQTLCIHVHVNERLMCKKCLLHFKFHTFYVIIKLQDI